MKIKDRIIKLFYIFFSVQMFLITVLSLSHPGNNLFPGRMMFFSVIIFIIFFLMLLFWNRICSVFSHDETDEKKRDRIITVLILIYVIFLFVLSIFRGEFHNSAGDYEYVFNSAREIALGNEVTGKFYNYFMVFGNNTKPMLFLSQLFKMSLALGLPIYIFALLWNILLVALSILSVNYLFKQNGLNTYRIPFLAVFALCLPVYVFSNAYYTDSMSFGCGVIAFAMLHKGVSCKSRSYLVYMILSSLFTVAGITVKITSIIPLIAGLIVLLINSGIQYKKNFIVYIICSLLMLSGMNIWTSSFDIQKESKIHSNPIICWIALGMRGDGSFAENFYFSDTIAEMNTREEKLAYTKEYIEENIAEAFTIKHIFSKITVNYSQGHFDCSDVLSREFECRDLLWELYHPWGKYIWRGSQYSYLYTSNIYIFVFLGSVLTLINLFRKRSVSEIKLIADLSFFGLFVFLMLWEASNRQLYNQLPMILAAMFAGAASIIDMFNKVTKKDSNEQIGI